MSQCGGGKCGLCLLSSVPSDFLDRITGFEGFTGLFETVAKPLVQFLYKPRNTQNTRKNAEAGEYLFVCFVYFVVSQLPHLPIPAAVFAKRRAEW